MTDRYGDPIRLEKRRVATSMAVRRATIEVLDDADSFLRDELRVSIEAYVLADHLVGDTYVTHAEFAFPASPWQHFKHKHAGSWWLRWLVDRRPVRRRLHRQPVTVRFDRYATYPDARIREPERLGLGGIVTIHETAAREDG